MMKAYIHTANKGAVNLRAEPSPNAKVLTQIPNKTSIEIEYVNNDWSKTGYNGKIGYVMTKFLTTEQSIITKNDLQEVYNSLKSTLVTIEKILK